MNDQRSRLKRALRFVDEDHLQTTSYANDRTHGRIPAHATIVPAGVFRTMCWAVKKLHESTSDDCGKAPDRQEGAELRHEIAVLELVLKHGVRYPTWDVAWDDHSAIGRTIERLKLKLREGK